MKSVPALLSLALLATTACAGRARSAPGPNARPLGCQVEIVESGIPTRTTHSVGHVVARCRGDAATIDQARCRRQLQDEACRLGGEVIWAMSSATLGDDEGLELRAEAGTYSAPQSQR